MRRLGGRAASISYKILFSFGLSCPPVPPPGTKRISVELLYKLTAVHGITQRQITGIQRVSRVRQCLSPAILEG